MQDTTQLSLKKPLKWYNQQIKIDFKKVFITLSKAVVSSTKIDGIQDTIKDLFDLADTVKIEKDPGVLAYELILKAMVNAAHDLSCDARFLMNEAHQENEKLYDSPEFVDFIDGLNQHLETKELSIDRKFFDNPRQISLLEDFQQSFKSWLQFAGLTEQDASNISNRLPAYFVLALNQDWRDHATAYSAVILQETETPFTPAAKRELEWTRYSAYLQKQVDEPVFAETFSLKQIYIPLRAYTKKVLDKKESANLDPENNKVEKTPFWLGEELNKWLKTQDARQCIRFISGGPGSGKSSFVKMWCAERAEKNDIKTILIPLQHFDVQGDIPDAVERFVRRLPELDFSFHPLGGSRGEKILLVFDGLDELSQQGKFATEIAGDFIQALNSYSNQINRDKDIKALFLITGRELAIQSNTTIFRNEQDISYVLPYFMEEYINEDFKEEHREWLRLDQRHEWWRKFSLYKGLQYTELPTELRIDRLNEVTAQPLLNYLVALGLVRNKIDFSQEVNLNIIYKDLIEGVHERAYAQKHKAIEGLNLDDFVRILEEIAISAWHGGDVRTTTVDRITKHIQENDLKPLMDKFEQEAKKGIIRLLTAFYFREHGTSGSGDKTFEFTHKSFGEYLTAARIVNMAFRITMQVEEKQKNYDNGWSDEEALKKWANITGPTAIDQYLVEFIWDEIKSKKIEEIRRCQIVMAKLLSKAINDGINVEPRRTHAEERVIERNSSEALVVVHSACANITREVSSVKLDTTTRFGEWCARLQPQRTKVQNCLAYRSFDYLDIGNSVLWVKDLILVNFSYSILYESELNLINFVGANLGGANLGGANLGGANLEGAHLEGANLERVNLQGAHLERAEGLTYKQLSKVYSLYKCQGIPHEIETQLRESHPHLFERPKWLVEMTYTSTPKIPTTIKKSPFS